MCTLMTDSNEGIELVAQIKKKKYTYLSQNQEGSVTLMSVTWVSVTISSGQKSKTVSEIKLFPSVISLFSFCSIAWGR